MSRAIALVAAASLGLLATPVLAKGCIKGAVVGAVAGHMAGHSKAGAAVGCAAGHHHAMKKAKGKG